MWPVRLFCAALLLVLAEPSFAARLPGGQKIGNWAANAYSNDATKQFSHCAASATYRSEITVYFSINADLTWVVAFSNPAWRLRKGATYDIAFTVDTMPPLTATATAFGESAVRVILLDSAELFTRFRRGNQLHVGTAGKVFSFTLTDTSRLLPVLLACAQNKGRFEIQTAQNPFEKSASPSREPPVTANNASAEAIAFAANLLTMAGISDFKILAPSESPEFKGDARWIANKSAIGTLNILSSATAAELKELPSFFIGRDAKTCKGTFFSGAIPDEGGTLARIFTTCQTKDEAITVYYLAVPRKAGGAYIISTFSVGTEQPAKEADASLRQAVFKLSSQ